MNSKYHYPFRWDYRANQLLGWTLLVIGVSIGIGMDPWSFSELDPQQLMSTRRMPARHAHAVVLGMACLQLAAARIFERARSRQKAIMVPAILTAGGALIYAGGYALGVIWPGALWLVPLGATSNFIGFVVLIFASRRWHDFGTERALLAVFSFGMLLDVMMGLHRAAPDLLVPAYLSDWTDVRLRMLRLARAAVIALSVLTLLYRELAGDHFSSRAVLRWGGWALLGGAIVMPLTLAASALTAVQLKYLLGIPAQAVVAGTLIACWWSFRRGSSLETFGWILVAFGTASGLLMGMYAFDGPLPSPNWLGEYNDVNRRFSRLAHAYWIQFGMIAILLARDLRPRLDASNRYRRLAICLFVLGVAITSADIMLSAGFGLPVGVLGVGPALVAISMMACLWLSRRVDHEATA